MADSLPIDPKRKQHKTEFRLPTDDAALKYELSEALDTLCDAAAVEFLNEFGKEVADKHDNAYEISLKKTREGNKRIYIVEPNNVDIAIEKEYKTIPIWRSTIAKANASKEH